MSRHYLKLKTMWYGLFGISFKIYDLQLNGVNALLGISISALLSFLTNSNKRTKFMKDKKTTLLVWTSMFLKN